MSGSFGSQTMHPGEYFIESGEIEANAGRRIATVLVKNSGDRPIQVGSHYHFLKSIARSHLIGKRRGDAIEHSRQHRRAL